jgi:hypothetical protein
MTHTQVTFVHGTFARGSKWPLVELAVMKALGPDVVIDYFLWSGRNQHADREAAAIELNRRLDRTTGDYPETCHYLIGHSHGGTVILQALRFRTRDDVRSVICLSTPFIAARVDPLDGTIATLLLLAPLVWLSLLCLSILPSALSRYVPSEGVTLLSLVTIVGLGCFLLSRRTDRLVAYAKTVADSLRFVSPQGVNVHLMRSPVDEVSVVLTLAQAAHLIARRLIRISSHVARALHWAVFDTEPEDDSAKPRRAGRYLWRYAVATGIWCVYLPMADWINGAADGRAFLFAPIYFAVAWASLALIVLAVVLLITAVSAPFVLANLLLMRLFGIRFNYHAAIFLTLAVEPAPPGLYRMRQLAWSDLRAGRYHSLSWQDEQAVEQIAAWLRTDCGVARTVEVGERTTQATGVNTG